MDSHSKQHYWLLLGSYASVCIAGILIIIKTIAWLYTGSASLLASLIDSMMDSLASIVNMLAIRYSITPADDEHRFGHGKAESLAAVFQSALIIGSGIFLLLYCAKRMVSYSEPHLQHSDIGIVVMLISIVLTLVLLLIQRQAIKQTQSAAIKADSLHYASDMGMNLIVILALVLANYGWQKVDLILGSFMALYISYGAVKIAVEAFHTLLDRELPESVVEKIVEIALGHPDVRGLHELRTRQSGTLYIIQFHIEVDDDISLVKAHTIADTVENQILVAFPNADVIIHQDPASLLEVGQQNYGVKKTGTVAEHGADIPGK